MRTPWGQVEAVHEVLREVPGTAEAREIIVLSKSDLADPVDLAALRSRFPRSVAVSCLTGEGLGELRSTIEEALPHPTIEMTTVIPYTDGSLLSRIHDAGKLLEPVQYREEGTWVHAL